MKYENQPDVRITVTLPGSDPVDVTLSYPLSAQHQTLLEQLHQIENKKGVIECRMHDDDYRLREMRGPDGRLHGAWLYLARHGDRIRLCHWPSSGVTGSHLVPTGMTDQHRRSQEYIALRGEANGYSVDLEKSLGPGSRSDVVVRGTHTMAAEVQVTGIQYPVVMRRARAADKAGACITWFASVESPPQWTHSVPTVLTNRNDSLAPNSWNAPRGPRALEWERCTPSSRFQRCPEKRATFCGQWHPIWRPLGGLTVDHIVEKVPAGGLVRLDTGIKQGTILTTPEDKARWEEHIGLPTKLSPVRKPTTPGLNHNDYSVDKLRERIRSGSSPSPVREEQIPKQSRVSAIPPAPADLALYSSKAQFGPNGKVARIADIDGHLLPITGYDCTACGLPVMPCYPDQRYHPGCDPNAPGWTEAQIQHWARRRKERLGVERGRELSERLLRGGRS